MFLRVGLWMTFCFALLFQIVASLDRHFDPDLARKGHRPHVYSSPDSSSTSEDMCTFPSPRQPPTCLCDCNNRDCDGWQKALTPCGSVVFYAEQKDLKFCKDDTFYQTRCKDQLDCLESIQCFLTCCLPGRGVEFMRLMIRSFEYEVLNLCHPDADPKHQQEFKGMTNCINAVWSSTYQCVAHWHRKLAAAATQHGADIPRYCCSFNDFADCVYAATDIDCCDDKQRLFYKTVVRKNVGKAYDLLCSDDCYTRDSPKCKCLSPVDNTGGPLPHAFDAHLAFARALTNSSNEVC